MSWEVRTMASATLSSNQNGGWFSAALLKKNFTRFWPLALFYFAVQFFALDMPILSQAASRSNKTYYLKGLVCDYTTWAPVFGVFFGLLFAMALFSYLMNHRPVAMLHSLPIRREGLFLTNYATALCFFLVPDLVASGIAAGAAAGWGVNLLPEVLMWLAVHVIVGMFFFSFAVCCAMFTGHILALPVFYGILNVLVTGVTFLMDTALNVLLLGYGGSTLYNADLTRWCTPVWHLMCLLSWDYEYADNGEIFLHTCPGLTAALGYSIVLLAVFTFIALWVYRLRELERAGDVVTVGWVRPVFQYGVGFCVGLTGGVWIYERFFYGQSPWAFIALAAGFAVVGAFVGRMFLKKTLRVFADGWRGPVALGVCVVALATAVQADLFGYQRWVPDPAQVVSVYFDGVQTAPYDRGNWTVVVIKDPEAIKAVTKFHAALVEDLHALREAEREDARSDYYTTDENGYEREAYKRVEVEYTLADGSVVRRRWPSVPVTAEALADENSYAAKLRELVNRPEVVKNGYFYNRTDEELATLQGVGGWLENINDEQEEKYVKYEIVTDAPAVEAWAPEEEKRTETDAGELTSRQAEALWAAVKQDFDESNFHRYLLEDAERYDNCYMTDLTLTLMWRQVSPNGQQSNESRDVTITVQKSAKHTMETLKELGLDGYLKPWPQAEK